MLLLDPKDNLSTVLTIDEAAEVARRTRRTINRWITQGRLRVLPGRRVVERELLEVERACRHAARQGRPGARVKLELGCLLDVDRRAHVPAGRAFVTSRAWKVSPG